MDDILDSELADLLRRPSVWQDRARVQVPKGMRELQALAERLADEDRRGAALVDSLADKPSAWWRTTVMKSPHGRTVGTVRQLLDRMRVEVRRSPARALDLTSLAVEIADDIVLSEYDSDFVISLRADAWRDYAYVLQFLGRLPEALAGLDQAERLLRQTALPEYGFARLKLVRAAIYSATDRQPEAVALAGEAAATFLEFGDRAKFATARITQAAMLHDYGAVREALDIWESIKNESVLDELNRVAVVYNLGLAYREIGNAAKAVEHVTLAIAEYELLGMTTEATRARWALATTLVSAGKFKPALPLFDRAWKDFEALEMEGDAALVALELAETLLVIGDAERVPQICRTLLDRFTRAGMTSRAVTALAYLREVVALGKAQPPVFRQVREFLRDLPSQGRPSLSLSLPEPER